jgi:hypothetical protein
METIRRSPEDHEKMIDTMMRKANRISDDPVQHTRFMALGARYAEEYWTSVHRHPATTLRALLRLTTTAQEYLEARYSFNKRLRETSFEQL